PVATVQVFNSSWATVFNQTYTNSPGTVNVNIGPGTYSVKVTFYTANWAYTCDKTVSDVVVINTCPAGTICVTNTCPSQTVDLNTAYAIPNLPSGTTVTWHTGTPATDANKMTDAEAQNVSASGTYYAAIHIAGGECYSATVPVNVTIVPCSVPSMLTTSVVQSVTEGNKATRSITAFPNPFTHSVRVVIDSEKSERATVILMDVQGRQLKQMPVQLVPGSNTVLLEGLDQFASGNYFLKINSGNETKTLKLIRQQ
ncbi:MAG TPA: T9SS type A sorting domain-containing protein, partial [Chitinophagaceae bacterium]|nr:T9SS type A sorting domain-containing protein [Chitinophagaceae bacterium]